MTDARRKLPEDAAEDAAKDCLVWADPRLDAYLLASGEERGVLLAQLLAGVRPIMERIVSTFRRAESVFHEQDAEDAIATATLRLIRRLDDDAASPRDAIVELDDYVATII